MKTLSGTILIVDDETHLSDYLSRLLRRLGFHVGVADSASMARARMEELFPDVVLMDLNLPDADGAEFMVELQEKYPDSQFIIITGHGSIRSAVSTTQHGAIDYLQKPFEPDDLVHAIQIALQGLELGAEIKRHRDRKLKGGVESAGYSAKGDERKYRSRAIRQTYSLARRAVEQDGIVLLLGESGTGKDHLAQWIHSRSGRASGPFFDINCASLPRELAESELFGHEPGAFTGTRGRKRGLLELAKQGTLLLNEIGELELPLQSKLLSFLDTRSFVRVGGEQAVTVDARILAATNRSLADDVESGRFREDLYYRLNVFPIEVPPLRERLEDIPMLVDDLLECLRTSLIIGERPSVSEGALQALAAYSWPGNIRELRNVLERAIILSGEPHIERRHLNLDQHAARWELVISFESGKNLHDVKQYVARQLIAEALRRSKTKQEAAKLLGISRYALAYQCKTLGVEL